MAAQRSGENRIYFNRASVLDDAFDALTVGTRVAFVEAPGEKGPQASTVRILGKHPLRHALKAAPDLPVRGSFGAAIVLATAGRPLGIAERPAAGETTALVTSPSSAMARHRVKVPSVRAGDARG